MKKIYIICLILNLFLVAESKGQVLTANDILVAQDSIHSVTYDEQTVWTVRKMLMDKLLKDTLLVSEDSSVTAFYTAHISDNIGKLSSIRLQLDTMYNMDSTTMANIQNNIATIDANAIIIAYDDSIIAVPTAMDPTPFLNQIDSCTAIISAATAAGDSIYKATKFPVITKANAIKSANNALSSSSIYEQNEIDINNIYLSTVAIGRPDSLTTYSTQLYDIARQCAFSGGEAVSLARSLYAAIKDSIFFDDDRICGSQSDTCLVPCVPGDIAGISAGVCGYQYYYSIDSMADVTGYTWTINGAATIDSGNGTIGIWISYADTFTVGAINICTSNFCGSGNIRTLVVTGYPNPPSSISGLSDVCAFQSGLSFSIDSVESATGYFWIVPSGCTIDSGQGTREIFVDWDSLPGNILAVTTNACGTSDTTLLGINVVECRKATDQTDIASVANGNVRIYPNPTTGDVTVIYYLSSDGLLQLFDITGRLMNSYYLDGNRNRFEFNIADLCCGIFAYRVIDNEGVAGQGKIVIVR